MTTKNKITATVTAPGAEIVIDAAPTVSPSVNTLSTEDAALLADAKAAKAKREAADEVKAKRRADRAREIATVETHASFAATAEKANALIDVADNSRRAADPNLATPESFRKLVRACGKAQNVAIAASYFHDADAEAKVKAFDGNDKKWAAVRKLIGAE